MLYPAGAIVSDSRKPRKVAWHKRWPGEPCLRLDLRTRKGTMIGVTQVLSDAQVEGIMSLLFPKVPK